MPIDPKSVQWDPVDPAAVQWDDQPPKPKGPPMSRGEKFARGMRDPLDGAAQLAYNLLPQGVQQAGNRLNNWLADNTGLVARVGQGGADQMVREGNAAYEAKRAAAGESGIDGYRLAGNVLNPANLAIASRIPQAATLAGRMGMGALGSGVSSLLQPATSQEDSFATEKAKQAAIGAAFGGAVPLAGAGLSRLVSPKASTDAGMQLLKAEGVRPTVGQTLGGFANKLEERAMSIPFLGDSIGSARNRATEDLNRAVANRALGPLGQKLPDGVQGREAVEVVRKTLGDAYDALLPKMTIRADNVFAQEVGQLRQMVSTGSMDPNAAKTFARVLQNDVLGKFKGQQALTGQTLKQIESDLGAQVSRFAQSTDADQRLVADALREVQTSLRSLATRNNPQLADELGKINAGYANFKRMERAASALGSEEGNFTAAQLQNAVKALDKSKDKGRFARGDALMQDLGDAAKTRLGSRVPDSGTAGRLTQLGTVGAAVAEPMMTLPGLAIGSAAYSPQMQGLLRMLVSNRPQAAQPVAGLLQQGSPMLAPAGGLLALQALQQ